MGQRQYLYYTHTILFYSMESEDDIEYIKEVKRIMEKDRFPTEVESGNNYRNMVTTNIQIFIVMRNTHSKFIDKILKEFGQIQIQE